jgi:hypothetical protein
MSFAKRVNKLGKSDSFEQMFLNAYDSSIKAKNKPRVSRPNIKPSKAGCIRQMFYILAEYPVVSKDSVQPDMYLIQQEGIAMHSVTQELLSNAKEQGIEFLDPVKEIEKAQQMGINTVVRRSKHDGDNPYEVTCYNEDYDLSFKFDGTVTFMHKKLILEIKNEDHFKFMKRTSPEPDHVFQGTFYSIGVGINYILFLYINRNYQKRKVYVVEITDDMRAEQINRIKIAKFCKEFKIVPAKTKHKGCTYCGHKSQCKEDGDVTHEGCIDPEMFEKFQIRGSAK